MCLSDGPTFFQNGLPADHTPAKWQQSKTTPASINS
jgi:hypothetical protein